MPSGSGDLYVHGDWKWGIAIGQSYRLVLTVMHHSRDYRYYVPLLDCYD